MNMNLFILQMKTNACIPTLHRLRFICTFIAFDQQFRLPILEILEDIELASFYSEVFRRANRGNCE